MVGDAVPAPAAPAKLSRRLLPGPAPLHAVRVPQGDAPSLRSVTLPDLAAPGVPLRCVVGDSTAPGRDRPSAAVVPRASVLPVAPGLSCRLLRKPTGTPSPPLPDSAPGWTPGLARCGAGPRRLCSHAGRVLRFRRPPGGGRRASSLNTRTLGGGLLPMPASLAPISIPPPSLPPSAVRPSHPRTLARPCLACQAEASRQGWHEIGSATFPADRRNSKSQDRFCSELRRARLLSSRLPTPVRQHSSSSQGNCLLPFAAPWFQTTE